MEPSQNENQLLQRFFNDTHVFCYTIDLQKNEVVWKNGSLNFFLGYEPFKNGHEYYEIPAKYVHSNDKIIISERNLLIQKRQEFIWQGIFRIRNNQKNWIWFFSQLSLFTPNEKMACII